MARVAALLALAMGVFAAPALAAYCHGAPSPSAQPNTHPLFTTAPKFVRSVPNGKVRPPKPRSSTTL